MEEGHKDWKLRFESTPEVAKIIEQNLLHMKNVWQIDLEEQINE